MAWKDRRDKRREFSVGLVDGREASAALSYGGARPRRDFALLAQAYLDGRLKLDELTTGRLALDDINQGFDWLRHGRSIRTVIEF